MTRLLLSAKMIILLVTAASFISPLTGCVIDEGCTSDTQCPLGYECKGDGLCYLQDNDYVDPCQTDADCPGDGLCECTDRRGCVADEKECTTLYLCESDLNCPDDGSFCNALGYCDF